MFGPDPAMSDVTTMGSVVAIDAGGSHWLKYGSARSNVGSLQIVLADGQVMEVGREPLVDGAIQIPPVAARAGDSAGRSSARTAQAIATHRPKSLVNRCGYQLAGRARRWPSGFGEAVGRFGRNAGADHRNDRGHASACRSIAGTCAAVVRSIGKRRPCRRGDSAACDPSGLRLDGSAALEPGPRKRRPLSTADSGRDRGRCCWSNSRATTRSKCATACGKSSTGCGGRSGWRSTRCRRRIATKWSFIGGWPRRSCPRSTA